MTNQNTTSPAKDWKRESDGAARWTYLLLLHSVVIFITGFVLAAVQDNHFALCLLCLLPFSTVSFSLNFHVVNSGSSPFRSPDADSVCCAEEINKNKLGSQPDGYYWIYIGVQCIIYFHGDALRRLLLLCITDFHVDCFFSKKY